MVVSMVATIPATTLEAMLVIMVLWLTMVAQATTIIIIIVTYAELSYNFKIWLSTWLKLMP